MKLTLKAFACIVALTILATSASSQTPAFSSAYSLTKTGFGSADRITEPGTIYVVRVDGFIARAVANHVTPTNIVTDGKLLPPAKGFIHSFGVAGDADQVKPGQRFYLHEIKTEDDSVTFTLLSLDTISTVVNGQSLHSRLRFYIKFSVGKSGVEKLTAATAHELTDPFFLPEGTAALTPTVQLGQTLEEVKKILGDPVRVIDLGSKKVLVYKDIKVTLIDGKVTDAE